MSENKPTCHYQKHINLSLLMAKGHVSSTKGKVSAKAPVKKPAPKKAQPQKATSKKKGHQKRAAPELSSEEDSGAARF